MPVANKLTDNDEAPDFDRDKEREREKSSKNKGSAKVKDLSHVPCKFFKVGSCTAGPSCPFSHSLPEPGQQKDVCTWFVKGNCKFGHKCALAHVLPGQSMAMDRKNKKAAQVAAGGGQGREGGRSGKGQKSGQVGGQARNPLLTGSTAPTRILSGSSRGPITMPLKATISPSAPAPPLKDTDFASFSLPDEDSKLASAPALGKLAAIVSSATEGAPRAHETAVGMTSGMYASADSSTKISKSPPSPIPLSTPSVPVRFGPRQGSSPARDLGPIGSPPRSSPSTGLPTRINGFSPGTSPHHQNGAYLSSSPFSAPGTQSVFLSNDDNGSSEDFRLRSGIAASLGASRTWMGDQGPVPSHTSNRVASGPSIGSRVLQGEVVEDDDLEEFLPGSLTDLLTPGERSRRFSRTNSSNAPATAGPGLGVGPPRANAETHHHRYSRSVPATSLLGEIKSIWADSGNTGAGMVGSPGVVGIGGAVGLGSGAPSSFKSTTSFGSRGFGEDHLSPSHLSPSNASAAFLPGLHHHYLNSKTTLQRPSVGTLHSASHSPFPSTAQANVLSGITGSAPYSVAPNTMPLLQESSNSSSSDIYFGHASGRPIPGGSGFGSEADDRINALSPSARALQAHAPGQSLPQGLAAGYSRIHALPPPPSIPSPSFSGAFSPPQSGTTGSIQGPALGSPSRDWIGTSPGRGVGRFDNYAQPHNVNNNTADSADFSSMFSRLSYSAAASRAPNGSNFPSQTGVSSTATAPMGMGMRNPSGRSWQGAGLASPLSGPVLTGDDDDLFSMDG